MRKTVILVLTLAIGAFLLFWLPGQIPHAVTFVDIETNQPIANMAIEIFYNPVCTSSPCSNKQIFIGQTDQAGSIQLKGHDTLDLNQYVGGIEGGSEYFIKIDGYLRPYLNDSAEDDAVVYLIKIHDINYYPIYFNWNEITIEPPFDLKIGQASKIDLSGNNKFLYIATSQGGGYASFIYDVEKKTAHYLGNEVHGRGRWLSDGRIEIVNYEVFGEQIGKILSTYRSINNEEPWIIQKQNE